MRKILICTVLIFVGFLSKYLYDEFIIINNVSNIENHGKEESKLPNNGKKIAVFLAALDRVKPEENEDEIFGNCIVRNFNRQILKREKFPPGYQYWIIKEKEKVWGYNLGAPNQYQFYVGEIKDKIIINISFSEHDSGPFDGHDLLGSFELTIHENGQINFKGVDSAPSSSQNTYNGTKTVDVILTGDNTHYVAKIAYMYL